MDFDDCVNEIRRCGPVWAAERIAAIESQLAESTDKLRHAEAEIERLRAQVDEALGIQERNFGHGSDTHMELHSWAKRVREARNGVS